MKRCVVAGYLLVVCDCPQLVCMIWSSCILRDICSCSWVVLRIRSASFPPLFFLSTHSPTHWRQVQFIFTDPLPIKEGETVSGMVTITRNKVGCALLLVFAGWCVSLCCMVHLSSNSLLAFSFLQPHQETLSFSARILVQWLVFANRSQLSPSVLSLSHAHTNTPHSHADVAIHVSATLCLFVILFSAIPQALQRAHFVSGG